LKKLDRNKGDTFKISHLETKVKDKNGEYVTKVIENEEGVVDDYLASEKE
jgi:hypothetical protein